MSLTPAEWGTKLQAASGSLSTEQLNAVVMDFLILEGHTAAAIVRLRRLLYKQQQLTLIAICRSSRRRADCRSHQT